MNFNDYLTLLAKNGGSDLFLSTGAPPCAKFHGKLKPLDKDPFTPGEIRDIAYEIMDDEQQKEFDQELEMNLAYAIPKVGRFRVNIFKQRNEISIVARNIVTDIPNVDSLGLPSVLKDVIMTKRGLVLFVGATGSGKSTSLAALIDHRNTNSSGHIITIEDPIEFIHRHKRSIVNQREIGVDTRRFQPARNKTLRQAPDVVVIGEIRDRETMEHAIAFAETGHLCISTLHANNANQALDRIINFFPEERRNQLLLDLSLNLKCFVSQRLIPTLDGKRCAAIEILLGTPTVAQAIHKGEVESIKEIMAKSENLGMQTFDAALFKLYEEGKISFEDALKNADSSNNLRLRIKLESTRGIPAGEEEPDTSSSNRKADNAFSLQIEEEPPEPES